MSLWAQVLEPGGGRHRGRSLLRCRTVGFGGGGEEAVSFPKEGLGHNLGGVTSKHLEAKRVRQVVKRCNTALNLQFWPLCVVSSVTEWTAGWGWGG